MWKIFLGSFHNCGKEDGKKRNTGGRSCYSIRRTGGQNERMEDTVDFGQ